MNLFETKLKDYMKEIDLKLHEKEFREIIDDFYLLASFDPFLEKKMNDEKFVVTMVEELKPSFLELKLDEKEETKDLKEYILHLEEEIVRLKYNSFGSSAIEMVAFEVSVEIFKGIVKDLKKIVGEK